MSTVATLPNGGRYTRCAPLQETPEEIIVPIVDDRPKRICAGENCSAVLSRYNQDDLCSACKKRVIAIAEISTGATNVPKLCECGRPAMAGRKVCKFCLSRRNVDKGWAMREAIQRAEERGL